MMKHFFSIIFLSITLPCFSSIKIWSPENNSIFKSNDPIYFICQCEDENAQLTLQISTDINFNNIVFQNSSRWLIQDTYYKQLPISPQELGNGIFYWRVSYDNTYSSTMCFEISGQHNTSDNYTIKRDANEYPIIKITGYDAPLVLSSLWIRSENTNNGLCQTNDGGYNHGIAVKDDIIYISYGYNNEDKHHLNRYNANTGESLDSIPIDYENYGGDENRPYRALCDLGVDDNGSIYTTNCGSNTSSNPSDIYVDVLDVTTDPTKAKVIKRYTCKLPSSSTLGLPQEVFYTKVSGDVMTGEFSLYSVLNSTSTDGTNYYATCTWTFSNGATSCNAPKPKYIEATTNSERTRIYPLNIESNHYIIDNNIIYPTIYKNRTKINSIEISPFEVSGDPSGNGIHIFNHGNIPMMIYGCNFKIGGSMFELVSLNSGFFNNPDYSFKNINSLWKFPSNYLGNKTPKINATLATTTSVKSNDQYPHTRLYIYSAGNGLAAYELYHYNTTKIENIPIEDHIKYEIRNQNLILSTNYKDIKIYNINGNIVSQVENSNTISLRHLSNGVYIAKFGTNTIKIII